MDLYTYFDRNFKEGQRYDLIIRLAGSCVVCGVPLQDCINFYKQFRYRDDEDRTYLIERTYRRFQEGKKVITLKPYGVDIKSYFLIEDSSDNVILPSNEKEEFILSKIKTLKYSNKQQTIDINVISVKLDKKIHIREYFYLRRRKITDDDIKRFDIRVGIDRLKDRVVFPIYNKERQCIYYASRAIKDDIQPRYLNSKLPKESVIWNYWNCDFSKPVIVCEGIFNAISAYNYTGIQSVATLGKYISENQKIMLSKFPKVILCLDGDVGKEYIYNLAEEIKTEVDIVWMPGNKDVNDLTKKEYLIIFNNREKVDKSSKELENIIRRLR